MGKTIERLGYGHLKGSSTRGGARAIRELSGILRGGNDIGLTVDGPRGPRGKVQQGAIEVGRRVQAGLVPGLAVVAGYGEPILVPGDAGPEERERLRLLLEERLLNLTADFDGALGFEGMDRWPHEDH